MVKITALFVASALVATVAAAPVAEKRQINFGSGNGIGNGNFQFNPPACKRQDNFGSGNIIGSGNGIVCTRDQEEEWAAIEKRQINFGSNNGIGNGNFGVRPCKRLAAGNYGSGNQIGGNNGIICTREEDAAWAEFNKRQINFGSGNEIGDGNFQIHLPEGGSAPSLPSLPKRQINGGSNNGIGNGNFGIRPCKRLVPGSNFLSGNQGGDNNGIICTREEDAAWAELEKRQTNIGSGNGIGNGNFQFNPAGCKRQLNFGSGNIIGSSNGILCP